MGQSAGRLRPRHRPGGPRPALRDRLDQAARPSSAGAPRTATSRRASPRRSTGTARTNRGGRPPKDATEAFYAIEGSVSRCDRVRKAARAHRDADSRARGVGPARARRHPRLVQGELAAREDDGARPARLRSGAEQHLVQRRRRHDARHPRRALGQVGLGRDRTDLRRLGRPARGARRSAPCSPPNSTRRGRSSCRAGWATRIRRSSRTPRTPTS